MAHWPSIDLSDRSNRERRRGFSETQHSAPTPPPPLSLFGPIAVLVPHCMEVCIYLYSTPHGCFNTVIGLGSLLARYPIFGHAMRSTMAGSGGEGQLSPEPDEEIKRRRTPRHPAVVSVPRVVGIDQLACRDTARLFFFCRVGAWCSGASKLACCLDPGFDFGTGVFSSPAPPPPNM